MSKYFQARPPGFRFDDYEIERVLGTGGAPRVRGNRIHDTPAAGLYLLDQAAGRFENNQIYNCGDNRYPAVYIAQGTKATVTLNRINGTGNPTIFVEPGSASLVHDNEVAGG